MIKHNFNIFLILLFILTTSCTKEVDFDQVDDLEINPVIESSLFYFDAVASDFPIDIPDDVIGGFPQPNQLPPLREVVIVDFFSNQFSNDNLTKAELFFETVNSINSAYRIQVDFLDISSQLQHSFNFLTEASSNNEDTIATHSEIFEGNSLINLKQTRQIVFTFTVIPETPINELTPGKFHLESKGVFYLNIKERA